LAVALALSIAVAVLAATTNFVSGNLHVGLGLGLVAWLVLSHLQSLLERFKRRGLRGLRADLGSRNLSYYGMWLAHLGVAVFIVGATLVSNFGFETDVRMSPGGTHEAAGFTYRFNGTREIVGPNYRAQRGEIVVSRDGREIATLHPEKRAYVAGGMPMTEAGIDPGFLRDIYVSLGEPVGDKGDWAVRLYYKPYVRWIWLGGILMAIGGLLAVADRRYRTEPSAVRRGAVESASGLARA
jgi:cytochrome c-type biogenesis protein CcmF